MKRANRPLLFAGVLLAAVAFVAVLAFGSFNQQAPPTATDVSVVVAATDLGLGTELTMANLSTASRTPAEASGTFQHPEDLVGRIVRRGVAAGQALTSADFDTGVDVLIAQSLKPGLRGIAVPLSRVDSVGALLQAGDYVDVLLSLEESDALDPIVINNPNAGHTNIDGTVPDPYISLDNFINNTTVKVVVQKVQVLAAIQRTADGTNNNTDAATLGPEVVVVLAVTPQQSEVIRFAQLDGNVSLVLRAPGDSTAADTTTTGITLKQLVDLYGVLPPAAVTP